MLFLHLVSFGEYALSLDLAFNPLTWPLEYLVSLSKLWYYGFAFVNEDNFALYTFSWFVKNFSLSREFY